LPKREQDRLALFEEEHLKEHPKVGTETTSWTLSASFTNSSAHREVENNPNYQADHLDTSNLSSGPFPPRLESDPSSLSEAEN
jgi:hypothetical protein